MSSYVECSVVKWNANLTQVGHFVTPNSCSSSGDAFLTVYDNVVRSVRMGMWTCSTVKVCLSVIGRDWVRHNICGRFRVGRRSGRKWCRDLTNSPCKGRGEPSRAKLTFPLVLIKDEKGWYAYESATRESISIIPILIIAHDTIFSPRRKFPQRLWGHRPRDRRPGKFSQGQARSGRGSSEGMVWWLTTRPPLVYSHILCENSKRWCSGMSKWVRHRVALSSFRKKKIWHCFKIQGIT